MNTMNNFLKKIFENKKKIRLKEKYEFSVGPINRTV